MHFRAESKAIAKPCRAGGPVSATCVQRAPSHPHVSASGVPPGSPPNRMTRWRSPSYVSPWLVRLLGPMSCFWVQKNDGMCYRAIFTTKQKPRSRKNELTLFEIALVLVHLDQLASFIRKPGSRPGDDHRNQAIPKRLEVL